MTSSDRDNLSEQARHIVEQYRRVLHPDNLEASDLRHIHFGYYDPDEARLELEPEAEQVRFEKAVVKMIEFVAAPTRVAAGDTIVDVGCGIGGTMLHLAETRGCRVIGLNVDDHQLELGRTLAKSAGLEHLTEFRFSDCSVSIDMPDESVDVILSMEAAASMSDRGQLLKECARILKPGGRISATDWMAKADISPEDYSEHIQPICDLWMLPGLETPDSYAEKLRDAGLGHIELTDIRRNTLPNARNLRRMSRTMRGALLFNRLPAAKLADMEGLDRLSRAWLEGYYQVQRFFARKPG